MHSKLTILAALMLYLAACGGGGGGGFKAPEISGPTPEEIAQEEARRRAEEATRLEEERRRAEEEARRRAEEEAAEARRRAEEMSRPRSGNLPYPMTAWNRSWYDASRNITWTRHAFGTQHYGASRVVEPGADKAVHAPIYHDSSHFGGLGLEAPERRFFVGVDQSLHQNGETPPVVAHHGAYDVRYGRVNDGVGYNRMLSYVRSGEVSRRFNEAPTLKVIGNMASASNIERVVRAVQLVNPVVSIK